MSAGLARQDFAAMKILPGAKRRCGDFLAQTRRARPCLPQRLPLRIQKPKGMQEDHCMNGKLVNIAVVLKSFLEKSDFGGFPPLSKIVCITNVHLAEARNQGFFRGGKIRL